MSALHAQDGAPCMPLLVTQYNCEAAFGIKPRRFRELIRELGLRIIEIGKLRAVESGALLEALRKRALDTTPPETELERTRRALGLK